MGKSKAQYVATDMEGKTIEQKNFLLYLPKPPMPGEIMVCRDCGDSIPPESFPKSKTMARILFKYQLCEVCYNNAIDLVDRSTPGLMQDRKIK